MKKAAPAESASKLIDARIQELADWRGKTLAKVRQIFHAADPGIVEEWKWGIPVWSHGGIVSTGETYKAVVKLTFARGAMLKDPARLFNSSLEGNVRRAIDIREGEKIDAVALKELIRAAVALNHAGQGEKKPARTSRRKAKSSPMARQKSPKAPTRSPRKPTLLAGGNPRIAKAGGDAPVQAYIAAMPGWKREVGRRLDAIVTRAAPDARKAVKWNSPFYGIEGKGWFLSFHVFTKYVKVAFFNGASLRPLPPGESRSDNTRYLDVHEGDALDEKQLAAWVKQASRLPGWGRS